MQEIQPACGLQLRTALAAGRAKNLWYQSTHRVIRLKSLNGPSAR